MHWGDGNSRHLRHQRRQDAHLRRRARQLAAITVDLVDEDGTFLDAPTRSSVTVDNVAPTIAISGAANVERGLVLQPDPGRGHRPGHRHGHAATSSTGATATPTPTAPTAPRRTPTPTGPTTATITVDLVDEDGTFLDAANALSACTVDNVAPTIAISGAANVNEGSAYSLTLGAVTDPGTDTVTSYIVHWGDGNSQHLLDQRRQDAHLRRRPQRLERSRSTWSTRTAPSSTAPTRSRSRSTTWRPSIAISGAANVNEGSAYSLTLGAVTDPGTDTVTSYVVHWGDGNTDTYATNGAKTHTYADGPHNRDDHGRPGRRGRHLPRPRQRHSASRSTTSRPTIAISGAANVNEGSAYSLTLGAVTDPGTDTVTSYIVHWGDGNTEHLPTNGAKTHTYADGPAPATITVDLVDEDGTFLDRANAQSVTVNNVAPTVVLAGGNTYTWPESTSAERTFVYSASDPGRTFSLPTPSTAASEAPTSAAHLLRRSSSASSRTAERTSRSASRSRTTTAHPAPTVTR